MAAAAGGCRKWHSAASVVCVMSVPAAMGTARWGGAAARQVKGYGTRLMDKLKECVKANEGLTHLITFADNNAVGYFQKQARAAQAKCR